MLTDEKISQTDGAVLQHNPTDSLSSPPEHALDYEIASPERSSETGSRPTIAPWRDILYEILETLVLAAAIWLAVNVTTARYVVEGISMEPSLHTGQFLIINKLAYLLGNPQRGDIVVFDYPGNTSDDYVKRIIGMPGDVVSIDNNGQVVINGEPINEPYLSEDAQQALFQYQGEWNVPDDAYFVMGDNRGSSSDSRTWGTLGEEFIIGKAWISYWPPSLWSVVPHYDLEPKGPLPDG